MSFVQFGVATPDSGLQLQDQPACLLPALCLRLRQASEQYLTSFHTAAHFFRQAKGLPQTAQTLVGRSCLRRARFFNGLFVTRIEVLSQGTGFCSMQGAV